MFRQSMVSFFFTCLGASLASAQSNVQVRSVVKVFLNRETAGYSVAFDYNFPERPSVYIRDLGIVPPKGSFRYISEQKLLEFRDSPGGAVLASVPLQETVIVASKPPLLNVPEETSFPEDFQSFTWDSPLSLQERADSVLNKAFRYHPRRDKEVTLLKTTFTPLPSPDLAPGVTAQIALLLSFPYDPESGKYSFHVQFLVMEGRTHSDKFQATSNPAILHAADDFVRSLIDDMKSGKE